MMPSFPEKVENVTVTVGQNAELKCKVQNLNNYKVRGVEYTRELRTSKEGLSKRWRTIKRLRW